MEIKNGSNPSFQGIETRCISLTDLPALYSILLGMDPVFPY